MPGAENSCFGFSSDEATDEPIASATPGSPGTELADVEGDAGCAVVDPVAPVADPNLAEAQLTAAVGINPTQRGLTGMETWLWAEGAPTAIRWTQTGTAGLDEDCTPQPAPTATFTATVHSWRFAIHGEHERDTYTAARPGSEAEPAATHVFDHVDTYTIELLAQLGGAVAVELPVATTTYDVVEVRSRLTH